MEQNQYLKKLENDNSDDYDKKCLKMKFDSDDVLPFRETLEIHDVVIVVRYSFNHNNKYYQQTL